MDAPPYLGETLALCSPMAWACAVILFRKTGESVPPMALNLFKNSFATPLFLLTFLAFGAVSPEHPGLGAYALLLVSGAIGIAVADTLFFMCLNRIGASRQAIVNTAYSPPIIILSVLFLGERLSLTQVLGVLLILTAVLCISFHPRGLRGADTRQLTSGILLGVGACVAQAVSIVMIKPFMHDWPLLWMTTWRLAGGLGASILVLPLISPAQRDLRPLLDRSSWRFMLPAVFLGTYVSLLLWMGGFKYADASVASALNQTATLFTFVLAVLVLREPVNRRGVIGLVLGLVGVLHVTFPGLWG